MPTAEEIRNIEAFDRKNPSLYGAGRILISKGETARIYAQMSEKGFAGKKRYGDKRDLFSAYTHELDPETGEVKTTVYACEYLGDNILKPYGRLVSMGDLSGERRDAHYNRIREEFDNRISEIGNRLRNRAGDLVIDLRESERGRNDNGAVANDENRNKTSRFGSDDKGGGSLPHYNDGPSSNFSVRNLHDGERIVGSYNRATGEVKLAKGASVVTPLHGDREGQFPLEKSEGVV